MHRKLFLTALLVCALIALALGLSGGSAAATTDACDPTATTGPDTITVSSVADTTYCNVQAAINAATSGDTINLSGAGQPSGPWTGQVTVSTPVTITGGGTITASSGPVVSVPSGGGGSTLSGVTVTGGSGAQAISAAGSLTVTGSTITGGSIGIDATGGTVNVNGGTISGASAAGIQYESGASGTVSQSATIKNDVVGVNITGGSATVNGGTAISGQTTGISVPSGSVTMSGGDTISGNATGVAVSGTGSAAMNGGDTIKTNTTAGVSISGGSATVSAETLSQNGTGASVSGSSTPIQFSNDNIGGNATTGVAVSGGSVSVNGSGISSNGTGGAGWGVKATGGNTTLTGNTIVANGNGNGGGGIDVLNSSTVLGAHLNRIVSNGHNALGGGVGLISGPTVHAEDNWWGCLGGSADRSSCDDVTPSVIASPWITLSLAASPTAIQTGGNTSTVTASLIENTGGAVANLSQFPLAAASIPVGLASGSPADAKLASPTIPLSGGTGTTTLTSGATGGTATVTAALDRAQPSAAVTITDPNAPPSNTGTSNTGSSTTTNSGGGACLGFFGCFPTPSAINPNGWKALVNNGVVIVKLTQPSGISAGTGPNVKITLPPLNGTIPMGHNGVFGLQFRNPSRTLWRVGITLSAQVRQRNGRLAIVSKARNMVVANKRVKLGPGATATIHVRLSPMARKALIKQGRLTLITNLSVNGQSAVGKATFKYSALVR